MNDTYKAALEDTDYEYYRAFGTIAYFQDVLILPNGRKQYIRSSHARGTIQTPHNRYNRVDLSRLPPPLERSSQGVPGAIAPLELRDQAI